MNYRTTNKDIMIDDLDDLMLESKADCMYVDPPWGLGNLKYWRTMNKQINFPVDWICFLKRLKYIYNKHVNDIAYIEMGLRFKNDLISVFGEPNKIFIVKYGNKNKWNNNLIFIYDADFNVDLTGKTGLDLVLSALYKFKNKTVLDPCVGLGTTARAAKKLNINLFCNELNSKRLEKTLKILNYRNNK